ncbi:hypothetical protein SSPS47_18905 [Streptomyces sp. S4.7]|nr:hypothetical protein SSPS47_18905 [Streptomyces sp. S4.7]
MSYSQGWQEVFTLSDLPTGDPGTGMSLASTGDTGAGGGTGGLKHSAGPWTSASGTADSLRTSTGKSRSRLGTAHEGVASGAAGFSAVGALTEVMESWEKRLTAVRGECAYLDGALAKVAKEMGETDVRIEKSVQGVHAGESR